MIDTTEYPTWAEHSDKVTFVKQSADSLSKIFEENTFDLVFANRVFHHFVRDSWSSSFNGMADIMKEIAHVLKKDGFFGIIDFSYNGFLYDRATSKMIYALTSCSFRPLAFLLRMLGAKTAGVGVCFLSKKMWMKLFSSAGFRLATYVENKEYIPVWGLKKMLLLCKKATGDNLFVLTKSLK